MKFKVSAIASDGNIKTLTGEALSEEAVISGLKKRGFGNIQIVNDEIMVVNEEKASDPGLEKEYIVMVSGRPIERVKKNEIIKLLNEKKISGEAPCKSFGESKWVKVSSLPLYDEYLRVCNFNNSIKTPLSKRKLFGTVYGTFGIIAIVAGLWIALKYYSMDTSVEVPKVKLMGESYGGGRVNNIGLMQERQNGLIIGCVLFVIGVGLLVVHGLVGNKRNE